MCHQQKSLQTLPQISAPKPAFHSLKNTATATRPRDYIASLLLQKRVRCVGNQLMQLRPRVGTYSAVTENPRYRHRHFLPSFKALSGKKELIKQSMPRLAASTIPRQRQETRLCVVGETNEEHAPILSSTKKHSNCSKTPRVKNQLCESCCAWALTAPNCCNLTAASGIGAKGYSPSAYGEKIWERGS
jgi:hypothetical protein